MSQAKQTRDKIDNGNYRLSVYSRCKRCQRVQF